MKYNAFADVTTGKCSNVSGGWRYVGTIHNSAAVTRRYQIVVDYVSVPGNTVESRQILNVKSVRSHAVVAWSAQGAMGLSNVTCVIEHVQAWPTT